jgi:hypothetical protein
MMERSHRTRLVMEPTIPMKNSPTAERSQRTVLAAGVVLFLLLSPLLITPANSAHAQGFNAASNSSSVDNVSAPGPTQDKISRALQAAPPTIGANATIQDAQGTILRQGSSRWTCMPSSGPGSEHPMCNDDVWMRMMDAIGHKGPFHTDRIGISYMLAGDDNVNNTDPFDIHPDPGETWVQEGPHLMIVVPDVHMLDGIPDDPKNGGPYVMWRGTPYAHLMVPVGQR